MYRRVALRYVASYRAVASNQKPNLYKKVNLDFERKGKKKLNWYDAKNVEKNL